MRHKRIGAYLICGGLLLMAAALFLAMFHLWDEQRAAEAAGEALQELTVLRREEEPSHTGALPQLPATEAGETEVPDHVLDPDREMPAVEGKGGNYIGVLELPALGLELPVLEEWSDAALRKSPCRYSGSVYLDDMVVAAHNYKSHFGRLQELRLGDEVYFCDAAGSRFRYAVSELETLGKYDVKEMTCSDWDLTLFTCTYGGQERLAVRCCRTEAAPPLPVDAVASS